MPDRRLLVVPLLLAAALALASCARSAAAPAAGVTPLRLRVERRLAALESDLIAVRRDLHRHPEVSGEETRTAGIVAARLRAAGLAVRTGVGGHGVVATLAGGRPGPRVALRADMDAVFSDAPDPVEFRSIDPARRHVCGHDVHVTIALGVAEALAAQRGELPGTVVFVFQPAEERATGAKAMLADGVFADGVPSAIYALHTAPLEVGQVGSKPGVLLAGRDLYTVSFTGPADAAEAAARAIEPWADSLATIAPEAIYTPTTAPFRTPQGTRIRGAAGAWIATGRVACSSDSLSADTERRLRARVAAAPGVTGSVEYARRDIPGIDNDPALEARARAVMRSVLGDDGFIAVRGVVPAFSEDFGAFQAVTPGVQFWLGVSNTAKGTRGAPHTPDYVADEGAIGVGTRVMSALLLDALGAGR